MSIQWIRVPTFRAIVERTVHSQLPDSLDSPEAWQMSLQKAAVPANHPNADYSKIVEGITSGQITHSAQQSFYLKHGTQLLEEIDTCLRELQWGWLISDSGQFIGFDSPVALDGEPGQPIGFKNAGIVIYPVDRHLLLYGTQEA
jgi:hypothetical protein